MVVIILENIPVSLRGELTRWMIEPRTGVFVGHLSARVRDKLWEKCLARCQDGGVVQLWSTNTEQHFALRMAGDTSRLLELNEGLQLIKIPGENPKAARLKRSRAGRPE
ncbi:MAG TPA: type I-E CRISPR-associated endoribonuclease Cas2e [Anaerolineaceae bacterium]|nr:type I-E CRISPR-associated endoribonuclease Cas2e [Anaerolineaceae bacterium]